MRILTTTLCFPTADRPDRGVFVQRRAEAVARRHDVFVVSPQPWCPVLRPPPAARGPWTSPGSLPVSFPRMFSVPVLGWATDAVAYAAALSSEVKRLRRAGEAFDLLDAHFEYPDGVGAWLAARRLGLPVVVTLRGKLPPLLNKPVRRAQMRAMLRGADAVIAVSASLAGVARDLAGRRLRVDVIPNGVDTHIFHPGDMHAARSQLGWDASARYLLCVGHYKRQKGFDRLVEVLPEARRAAGDVRLVLVGSRRGEAAFQRRLRELLRTSPAGHAVTCLDTVESRTVNLMLNAADLSVNASRNEGWCNTIAESLAAGTPVVASDVGGNREQIGSDALGMVMPEGDPRALARGIVTGLARPWNRTAIAAHGARRTWDQVAAEVIGVFERVLAGAAGFSSPRPAAEIPGHPRGPLNGPERNRSDALVSATLSLPGGPT